MKFFITGASGFIGSRLCDLIIREGHEVIGLVRPASASLVPAGVRRVYGTLPYDVPAHELTKCDVVLHLAAITTGQRGSESLAVNELGTEYLLTLAQSNQAGFVFVSTQSAHGGNQSAYAVTKRRGEEMVRDSGLPWVIVRPGLVYGPGPYGLYARMRSTVAKLPVMPLLGGGKALVQPIHVDDLATALLRIATNMDAFSGSEVNVGDSEGLTLRDFLARMARAQGKNPRSASIPLGPVKAVVAVGEKMRLPLPVSMDNLRGLETVQRMDTSDSLERLQLTLRDLDEGLRSSEEATKPPQDDRIPVVLVGAGKIGIVHGLQLMHNPATKLTAIVEPNVKAADLYRSMGFKGPYFSSLQEVIKEGPKVEAAVIATPAYMHLGIARECLEAGLHTLVEKPLSISAEQAEEWRQLRNVHSDKVVHAGYMAAQFPHLLTAFHAARMNKLGHIYKANCVALQTHVMATEPVRWEMLKSKAGGGAMINFGCHVASILFRMLGWPEGQATGWHWPVYSSEVEDALLAKFSIKSTQCTLVVSWSVPGYARPFNMVELVCEHGTIRVENANVTMSHGGEITSIETQLDSNLDFNMSPDYTGGGFTLEHDAFSGAIKAERSGPTKPQYMPPMEMAEALRLESWIYNLYDTLPFEKPGKEQVIAAGFSGSAAAKVIAAGKRSL